MQLVFCGIETLILIFVNNQLDAQFFFLIFVYSSSLHVSSNQVLIIRTVNCINTTSGICHSENSRFVQNYKKLSLK